MTGILLTVFFTFLASYAVWNYCLAPSIGKKSLKNGGNAMYITAMTAAALILRLILAAVYKGHETDMNCFIAWSGAVFDNGISKFYTLDMFHDYPPGYMYVLYVLGAINRVCNLQGGALYILIKLPAIIADIISGVIIYKIAKNKLSDGVSVIIASLYFLNPAAVLNCSLWGQVDSVYTLFILLMIYFITEKKVIVSYFMYALCILVKPQAFIFLPVAVGAFIETVFLNDFSAKKLFKHIGAALAAIAVLVLLSLPFGMGNVVSQYSATIASYPNLTVNAFNLWGAFGKNWMPLSVFTQIIGYGFIAAIWAYALYVIFKGKDNSKYFFVGALLAFFTYMLSIKMHDRYAFPAMLLMLAAFALTFNFHNYVMYVLITVSQFFNTAWVLFVYSIDINKYYQSPVVIIASIINLALLVYVAYQSYNLYVKNDISHVITGKLEMVTGADVKKGVRHSSNKWGNTSNKSKNGSNKWKKSANKSEKDSNKVQKSVIFPKITRFDAVAMLAITLIYSCIALYNLGDMHAPETEYDLSNTSVYVDLGADYNIKSIKFFLGARELNSTRSLTISAFSPAYSPVSTASDPASSPTYSDTLTSAGAASSPAYSDTLTSADVFHWTEISPSEPMRYVTISGSGSELFVKEFAFINENGEIIKPVSVSPDAANTLFDEQNEVPDRSSYRNGTYFDEIYHARTGYEFVHSMSVYEWTHPPLGKVFIALGILLFGMCPFGWRIVGTVFGIIMVPIIYIFAKKLLKKSWLAIVTCLLFTFDFMHFAQTRIATIDVYVTFFIMLMYYFMYKYYSTSFYDTPFRKGLVYLALCGVCMGLGIASKWPAIWAGMGLAVLFFITIAKRGREYDFALRNPNGETNGISHKFIIENFNGYLVKTIIWCVIFFVLVPALIYGLSYIPYLKAPDQHGISSIFANQSSMYNYHSNLESQHSFSSRWYEWIIMKRPVWYYSGTLDNGLKEGISSFGNPFVWWLGIPAFIYMVYRIFNNRDKNSLFLVIAYVIQLVFWIPVTRLTFIYHYFPCVPFLVLMIGYSILCIYEGAKNKKAVMYGAFGYAALVIILFVIFYPVISGKPCSVDYADNCLEWFNSWILL